MIRIIRLIDWREVATIFVLGCVTLAALTYAAGFYSGRALHRLNDHLAAIASAPHRTTATAPQRPISVCLERPLCAPIAAPAVHPLAAIADDLSTLSRRQLSTLTGIRKNYSKARLIADHLATV